MEIGQEWVYKGSQNTATILDMGEDRVKVLFTNARIYDMIEFIKSFEPYAAKGQTWKLNGGYVKIESVTSDAIRYSRYGDDWACNKRDFFIRATRIL